MRTNYFFLIYLLLVACNATAQNNYNNHWFFGRGHNVNFTTGSVQNGGIPPSSNTNRYLTWSSLPSYSAAISDRLNGDLVFFVQIPHIQRGSNIVYKQIFYNAQGGDLTDNLVGINSYEFSNGMPLIVPVDTLGSSYYVFTALNRGLQYTKIVRNLLSNQLEVVPAEFMIPILPNGSIWSTKLTLIKGCKDLYISTRSATFNGFYTFSINENGLETIPLISYCGTLPPQRYEKSGSEYGTMKASPNGKLLAVATGSGVELYDIEPCSGIIKNPRLIDTTTSFGVCFSPDSKLLYATQTIADSMIYQHSGVFQYDVSIPNNVNSIINSKLLVLENTFFYWPFPYDYNKSSFIGDIAQGKDGKLYILSNTDYLTLATPQPVIPGSFIPWAQTMHIIHQPNNLGMACMPERDAHYLDGNYINRTGYYLPHPIYPVPNATIDTVLGGIQNVTQCFGQPVLLNLPAEAACIIWNTGSDSVALSVQDTGWYWTKYNLDCSIHLDSFYVSNLPLPNIPEYVIACPEQAILDIEVVPHNIHQYQYDLVHTNRNDPRMVQTDSNWTWYKLLPGGYTLRVQSGNCDTSIGIFVDTFPRPTVVVSPSTDTITYGTTIDLKASGAYLYNWFPTISLDTGTGASVRATPLQTTTYEIIGINEFGCRDTAYSQITIDHSMEFFIPNAFSPNGDGLNDVFRLEGLTFQRLTEWGIFNRFGEQVFFTTNIQDGWDGTYRGQPCDAGVYYYYLQFFRTDGRLEERRGEVHLVR